MVFVDVAGTGWPALEWVRRLDEAGLRVTVVPGRVRMLTHADVTARDIEAALAAWRRAAVA
jgi:threonine aldolase